MAVTHSDFFRKRIVHEFRAVNSSVLQRSIYRENYLIHPIYKGSLTTTEFEQLKLFIVKKIMERYPNTFKVNVKENDCLCLKIMF